MSFNATEREIARGVGATSTAVATGTADVAAVAAATNLRLLGFSFRESAVTAAVATIIIRNGNDATDPIVAEIELAANASVTQWFGPNGIASAGGVFVDRVAGETEGAVYTMAAE